MASISLGCVCRNFPVVIASGRIVNASEIVIHSETFLPSAKRGKVAAAKASGDSVCIYALKAGYFPGSIDITSDAYEDITITLVDSAWAATVFPFRNPALPLTERLDDLIGRLMFEEKLAQLRELITAAGLPTRLPRLDISAVLGAMRHDKKVKDEQIRFVLLEDIGKATVVDDVSPDLIREVLESGE